MALADPVVVASNWSFTSGTSLVATLTASVPAGALLIVEAACDNASTATTPTPSPFLDIFASAGGPDDWTLHYIRGSGSAAGSGVVGALWTAPVPTTMAIGATVTILPDAAVVAKAIKVSYIPGASITAVSPVEGGNNSFTPALAITPGAAGRMVYASIAREAPTGASFTQDPDTTNGTWVGHTPSGLTQAQAGSAASAAVSIWGAHKVVTADGLQTYNPTGSGGGGDWVGAVIVLAPGAPTIAAAVVGPVGSHSATLAVKVRVASAQTGYTATVTGAARISPTIQAAIVGLVGRSQPDIVSQMGRTVGHVRAVARTTAASAGLVGTHTSLLKVAARLTSTSTGLLGTDSATTVATVRLNGTHTGPLGVTQGFTTPGSVTVLAAVVGLTQTQATTTAVTVRSAGSSTTPTAAHTQTTVLHVQLASAQTGPLGITGGSTGGVVSLDTHQTGPAGTVAVVTEVRVELAIHQTGPGADVTLDLQAAIAGAVIGLVGSCTLTLLAARSRFGGGTSFDPLPTGGTAFEPLPGGATRWSGHGTS